MSKILKTENVNKFFYGSSGAKLLVLENINLNFPKLEEGSISSILAPFHAGKTTLLKMLCGLEPSSEGQILLDDIEINSLKAKIVFIPENSSSLPWLNVSDNIKIGCDLNKNCSFELKKLIEIVGLGGYETYFPQEENSGFRFRIALARAIAVEPEFILLDDPFRHIDSPTKKELYSLLIKIKSDLKINFILAATNVNESLILSSKIYLMKKEPGRIVKSFDINVSNRKEDLQRIRKEISEEFNEEILQVL